jgi:hypothetical protein
MIKMFVYVDVLQYIFFLFLIRLYGEEEREVSEYENMIANLINKVCK